MTRAVNVKASIAVSAAWTYLGFNIKVIKLGYNTILVFSRSMLLELCVYICVHACMPVRVCVNTSVQVPWYMCADQRQIFQNLTLSFYLWLPGIELRSSGLFGNCFDTWNHLARSLDDYNY